MPTSNRPQNRPLMSARPWSVPSHGRIFSSVLFAGAVRADDAEDFSFLDFKVGDVAQGPTGCRGRCRDSGRRPTSRRSPGLARRLTTPYGHASPLIDNAWTDLPVDRSIAHLDYIGEGSLHPPKNINPPINETITTAKLTPTMLPIRGSLSETSTEIPSITPAIGFRP